MNRIIDVDADKITLMELVAGLRPDDEIVIVKDRKSVARLVPTPQVGKPRQPGLMKGKLTVLVEDDAHLADFKEYMP